MLRRVTIGAVALIVAFTAAVLLWPRDGSRTPDVTAAQMPEDAEAIGTLPAPRPWTILTAPPPPDAAVFTGAVVGEHGEPVAGAELLFACSEGVTTVETDLQGRFVFRAPGEGLCTVGRVDAAGFRSLVSRVGREPLLRLEAIAAKRVDGVRFTLEAVKPVVVTVVGPGKQPLAGASVSLGSAAFSLEDAPPAWAGPAGGDGPRLTGVDGRVIVEAREYDLVTASAEPFDSVAVSVSEGDLSAGDLTIELEARTEDPPPRFLVRGVVVDERDAGVAGAEIDCIPLLADGGLTGFLFMGSEDWVGPSVQTSADGTFAIGFARGGTCRLRPGARGYSSGSTRDVTVPTEEVVRLHLVRSTARISGTVRAEGGSPITCFRVAVAEQGEGGGDQREFCSASGRYTYEGAPVGPVNVVADALGFVPPLPQRFETAAGVESRADFTLQRGATVWGVITDFATGRPLSGVVVVANPMDRYPAWAPREPVNGVTTSGRDGGFTLQGLEAGETTIRADPKDRAHVSGEAPPIDVPAGGTYGPVLIALSPGDAAGYRQAEYEGIGASLESEATDAGVVVSQLHPEGGASAAGLGSGDEIIAVDGAPLAGLAVDAAIKRIKGPADSVARLTVRRGRRTFDVHVVRRRLRW